MAEAIFTDTAKTLNAVIDLCETINMGGTNIVDTLKESIVIADSSVASILDSMTALIATIDRCKAADANWMSLIVSLVALGGVIFSTLWTGRKNRILARDNMRKEELQKFTEASGEYLGTASILGAAVNTLMITGSDYHYYYNAVKNLTASKLKMVSHYGGVIHDDNIRKLMDNLESTTVKIINLHGLLQEYKRDGKMEESKNTILDIAKMGSIISDAHSDLQDKLAPHIEQKWKDLGLKK